MQKLTDFYKVYTTNQEDFEIKKLIEPCVPFDLSVFNSTIIWVPRFCYQASGVEDFITLSANDEIADRIKKYISLLDQYSLTLSTNFTWYIQIAALSPAKFVATYPFFFLLEDYDVTNAPWYIEHEQRIQQNPDQSLVIQSIRDSLIYNSPELDISLSITDDEKAVAYMGVPVFIDKYLFPQIPYNVMLFDIEGKLLYNQLENGESLNGSIYIYDQNVTGFNESDWQIMEDNTGYTFQLVNKCSEQQVHVHAVHILQKNFTLIVYSNIQSLVEIKEQYSGMQADFTLVVNYFWLPLIGIWLILVAFQGLALWYVFKPLESLSSIVKNHVLSVGNNANKEMFKLVKQIEQDDSLFSVLQAKLLNLSDIIEKSQNKKSDTCKMWEAFKYDLTESNLNLDTLRDIIQYLEDDYQISDECQISDE